MNDATRFRAIVAQLGHDEDHRYVLVELHDFLTRLAPAVLPEAVAHANLRSLSPLLSNYVAAMVEQASYQKRVPPPSWAVDVEPLDLPYFASPSESLRAYLLRSSPVPFKRRNIFVDASVGDRV